ncbi:MAG: hypothetical protein V4506_03115 [Bacteroidota bacterium]
MKALINKAALFFLSIRESVLKKADPIFLLFILLITNYRFSLKIIAIIAIYIYRPNFKFKKSGVIYFYIGIIVLAIFNLLVINNNLHYNYIMVVLSGCLIWAACLLVFHQLVLFIELNTVDKIINSIKILVFLNFLCSLYDLFKIMIITHTLNPYTLISPPPYGISSGDLIGGVYGEMHLVNMTISSMMLIFFLYQKNFVYILFSIIPLLLTGSNFGTLISIASLGYIFIIKNENITRYYIAFSIAIVLVFYIKVTPENLSYLKNSLTKITHQVEHKPKVKVAVSDSNQPPQKSAEDIKIEKINNYSAYKYGKNFNNDTVYHLKQAYIQQQQKLLRDKEDYTHYVKDSIKKAKEKDKRFEYGKLKKFDFNSKSGKLISFMQTKDLLQSNWKYFLFGAGLGSFSSRLAFITSGIVDDSRVLMRIPKYENPLFANNHEAIFRYLLFLDDEYHSVTNLPFCWYNELLGEYGIIGLILFSLFYLGFFIKKIRLLTFGKLLLVTILIFFLFDYWYQRLSVMVLFELLMLLDIKIQSEKAHKHLEEKK